MECCTTVLAARQTATGLPVPGAVGTALGGGRRGDVVPAALHG